MAISTRAKYLLGIEKEVSEALFRNQKIGFIFQGFNLLARMSARDNVELPMVYAGVPTEERRARALQALALVGLGSRADHRPAELSGGQQQRVAVARALATRPSLVLADEPTGNLDSRTGLEVMMILQRMNARGITIVLVTHDPSIANYCRRQVKFRDGRIVEDVLNPTPVLAHDLLVQNGHAVAAMNMPATRAVQPLPGPVDRATRPPRPRRLGKPREYRRRRGLAGIYRNCLSALQSLRANKMRSLLTSLGIIIGVGAVIIMISISEASAASINNRLSGLNPTELIIRSGSTGGGRAGSVRGGAGSLQTLTQADADALTTLPNVASVSPVLNVSGQVVFQNQNWSTQTQGVYPDYQQIGSWQMQEGSFFSSNSGLYAVIGQTVVSNLFTPLGIDPLNQQIRIGRVSFTVVGVLASKGGSSFGNADDVVYVPFTTAQQQLSGSRYVGSIDVTADNAADVTNVQAEVEQTMEQRHNISNSANDDFTIQNQSQILQTVQATSQTLTVLLVGVASISLIVGGIGIMNIMLVSVTERTREIGIRMAIGARPGDVMTQFLIEAIMLSVLGGIVGILLGIGGGVIYSLVSSAAFVLSPLAVLLAFGFSGAVGIIFGFYPARRAARLDPIVALRTE